MDHSDVQILSRETAYHGYFRIDRYRLRHRRHDGGWTREITREVFERGHVAAVLPYDPDRDSLVLIEQFRIGAYAAGGQCWLTEVVAGVIDEGESAEEVARREMQEETGCTFSALEPIATYFSSPGGASETVALYVGRVDSTKAGGCHGRADEEEDIRVVVRSWAAVEADLQKGLFTNAATLIALQWLALNRMALCSRWSFPPA